MQSVYTRGKPVYTYVLYYTHNLMKINIRTKMNEKKKKERGVVDNKLGRYFFLFRTPHRV